MFLDRFKLNDDKTEYLLIGTRQQLDKLSDVPLAVGYHLIAPPRQVAKNVGCWFDQPLSMITSINKKICIASYVYLYNSGRIRKFLSHKSTKLLVCALVTSGIDYCSSLLCGLQQIKLSKLQRVQNSPQGHPTSIFGKYLFGRRFEIYNFRSICCKISCLPACPRIFEHLKNGIIAHC